MDLLVAHSVIAAVLAALVVLVAAVLGFLVGRRRPRKVDLARIAALEEELTAARTNAESTQGDIDEHFEASAALFGKLAQDYRSLFEHWADSATRLGVSEGRADAIIDQARSRLLEHGRTIDPEAREPDAGDPHADRSAGDTAAAPEEAPVERTSADDEPSRAAAGADATADPAPEGEGDDAGDAPTEESGQSKAQARG